jgi:hypothetical protein
VRVPHLPLLTLLAQIRGFLAFDRFFGNGDARKLAPDMACCAYHMRINALRGIRTTRYVVSVKKHDGR